MADAIAIFVCDTDEKAETARQYLLQRDYSADQITVDRSAVISYDAQLLSSGASDALLDKYVVIGRK